MNNEEAESADLAQFREFLSAHGLTTRQDRHKQLPRLLKWVFRALPVRGTEARPFGPEGFTTLPKVRSLLSPYEPAVGSSGQPSHGRDGLVCIDLLPASTAEQLLQLLPKANVRVRHESAPSFEQFVQLGR